ncbi:hypothetical protein EVG20_g7411 [Dentipellis fragilis]|uniref:Uncharacterized protein n=1 Tax=Dentipellis fragilis TaxID=205917 RepID=A0A4Y9YG69_9AGAM|nr:hypothetical protein EVG20_g7411 [Dentipellis fragilis]
MIILVTIIAAVLDLTVIIQRLALGGIHLLGLDGLHPHTLPAGVLRSQIVPAEPAAIPTAPIDPPDIHFAPLNLPPASSFPVISLSATCPAQPANYDTLNTEAAQVAVLEQELVVGLTEATDLSWLGSEVVEVEVPSDLIVSWTGELLPSPVLYSESPPTTSVALFEPQPSGMDLYWPWIYFLGFVLLSLSVNAAFAEFREVVGHSLGFVRISCLDIFLDFNLRIKFSGLQYRFKDLTIQANFRRHFSSLWISSLVSYHLDGFSKRIDRLPYIPSLIRATIGALYILQRGFDCARSQHTDHNTTQAFSQNMDYLSRCIGLTVQARLDIGLNMDYYILLYMGAWFRSFYVLVLRIRVLDALSDPRSLHQDHSLVTSHLAWQNWENSNRDKKVLRDGLQLATNYGSLRLNHLQRRLDSMREEAASARKMANKLHWDNQTLGHRTKEYMRVIASQTHEIKELELDNDKYHSQCAELKSALEEECATIVSLRTQLSSRRGAVLRDSCTQTSAEVDTGSLVDGADALGLYPEDGASDFDSYAQTGTEVDTVPVCAYESLVYGTDALDLGLVDNSYDSDSDSDVSECSVVEGTIFLHYIPDDGSSYSTDSDDGLSDDNSIALPGPPAIDLVINQASRYWIQHGAFMEKLYAQGIREKDGVITRLEQHLEKVNESWDFRLSQAHFLAAAQRDYIDTLEAKIRAGSSVKGDLVPTGSREIKTASSTSTLDLLQMVDLDASLLLDVSFPGMPHWPSDISFGNVPYCQDLSSENIIIGSHEESMPVLTPDHPPSGRTPSSSATSALPELVITPSELAVTTARVANDSSDIAESNRLFAPSPTRPPGEKDVDVDDDDPFQSGFPSWTSFALDLSASGFMSSPMDVVEGSPVVDDPIGLPDLPPPASFDDSLSPSPLASHIKKGNSDRPRQPILSLLNINRDS